MTKDDILPTSIRIPADLREAIGARAKANRRSVSQEVCVAIEYYLAHVPGPTQPSAAFQRAAKTSKARK